MTSPTRSFFRGSGLPKGSPTNRTATSLPDPSAEQSQGNYKTTFKTVQTVGNGQVTPLYAADLRWARVKLYLETAGPVAISDSQSFNPVFSGQGVLLQPGEELEFEVARGNKIFISSPTVNRVRMIVEPIGWGEQLLGAALAIAKILRGTK